MILILAGRHKQKSDVRLPVCLEQGAVRINLQVADTGLSVSEMGIKKAQYL